MHKQCHPESTSQLLAGILQLLDNHVQLLMSVREKTLKKDNRNQMLSEIRFDFVNSIYFLICMNQGNS